MKRCLGCCQDLPLDRFYARAASKDGLQQRCKDCDHEVTRANRLLLKYGLTVEGYDALYEGQEGRCATCGALPVVGRRLCVDHCHATGMVRGLLCDGCNLGLGKVGDDLAALRRFVAYLEAHEMRSSD